MQKERVHNRNDLGEGQELVQSYTVTSWETGKGLRKDLLRMSRAGLCRTRSVGNYGLFIRFGLKSV